MFTSLVDNFDDVQQPHNIFVDREIHDNIIHGLAELVHVSSERIRLANPAENRPRGLASRTHQDDEGFRTSCSSIYVADDPDRPPRRAIREF